MSSQLTRQLNAYPEWKNINSIQNVIDFIKNKKIPTNLKTKRQKDRFMQKFDG